MQVRSIDIYSGGSSYGSKGSMEPPFLPRDIFYVPLRSSTLSHLAFEAIGMSGSSSYGYALRDTRYAIELPDSGWRIPRHFRGRVRVQYFRIFRMRINEWLRAHNICRQLYSCVFCHRTDTCPVEHVRVLIQITVEAVSATSEKQLMVSPVAILFLLQNAPNCTSERQYFQNFSGGACPQTPLGRPLTRPAASPTSNPPF